jgi:predicted small secreted protein
MDEEPAMHRTILASVSALLLLGSAALAQSNTTAGQGQMITPGQEGGGHSSGTRIGEGATPSAGATGGQMDPGGEAGGTTTGRAAPTDCAPAGPADAQGADRSGETGNKPGC